MILGSIAAIGFLCVMMSCLTTKLSYRVAAVVRRKESNRMKNKPHTHNDNAVSSSDWLGVPVIELRWRDGANSIEAMSDVARQLEAFSGCVAVRHASIESPSILSGVVDAFHLSSPSVLHGCECVEITPGAARRLRERSNHLTGPLLVDWFQSESLPVHLVQLKAQGSVATRSFELNCRLNS